jgi:hypothetical protein
LDNGKEYNTGATGTNNTLCEIEIEESKTIEEIEGHRPAYERRRKNPLPDISRKIMIVYASLQKNSNVFVRPRSKGRRGLHNGLSTRRSQYVGVTKSGDHWQTLINVGKTKKYIGTYCSEREAALVYDFYAFGLRGLRAKTNFSHKGPQILLMIESFLECDNKFDPSVFVTNVA